MHILLFAHSISSLQSSEADDDLTIFCATCGQPTGLKKAMNHMERCFAKVQCTLEGGREGERGGEREGGREKGGERGREGDREGDMNRGRRRGREGEREGGKEGGRERERGKEKKGLVETRNPPIFSGAHTYTCIYIVLYMLPLFHILVSDFTHH